MDELFSAQEAARYLGFGIQTLWYHTNGHRNKDGSFVPPDLVPDRRLGRTLVFSKATLDEFNLRRRPAWGGRPLKDPDRGPVRPRPKKHEEAGK